MIVTLLPLLLAQAAASQSAGKTQPDAQAPSEIVAAAPAGDWRAIPASDLLVMDLVPNAAGRGRRVVIQLTPAPLSQGWVGNILRLATARWWDGTSVNRVQDNYVVQWGDADGENKAKAKPLPAGLATVPQDDYAVSDREIPFDRRIATDTATYEKYVERSAEGQASFEKDIAAGRTAGPAIDVPPRWLFGRDSYGVATGFWAGWPVASSDGATWPVHCYGMVGVGRNLSPDTGSGAELYTVIGHAPRHLDRNIALVGRVVEGIEHLSSLPRGTEPLGFYKTAAERTPILRVRLASELPAAERPRFEYLSTESASFTRYADSRANRRDAFFIRPAGGADICNVPVPVRRAK